MALHGTGATDLAIDSLVQINYRRANPQLKAQFMDQKKSAPGSTIGNLAAALCNGHHARCGQRFADGSSVNDGCHCTTAPVLEAAALGPAARTASLLPQFAHAAPQRFSARQDTNLCFCCHRARTLTAHSSNAGPWKRQQSSFAALPPAGF